MVDGDEGAILCHNNERRYELMLRTQMLPQ